MSIKNTELQKNSANTARSGAIDSMGWMRGGDVKLRLLAVAMVLIVASAAAGQNGRPAPPRPVGPPPIQHQMGTAPLTVDPREDQSPMYQEMKQQRNALRQKKLIEKTQELQQLSDELRAEVAKTDKDTLSVDVIRKSEKIEKLAKSIHELLATPL